MRRPAPRFDSYAGRAFQARLTCRGGLYQHEKQVIRIADDRDLRRGTAAAGKLDRATASRDDGAARGLQRLDRRVDVADLQLHPRRSRILDVAPNGSTVHAFEVDELDLRRVR